MAIMNDEDLDRDMTIDLLSQKSKKPAITVDPVSGMRTSVPDDAYSSRTRNVHFADGTDSGFKTYAGPPLSLDDPFFATESDGAGGSRFANSGNTEFSRRQDAAGYVAPYEQGGVTGGQENRDARAVGAGGSYNTRGFDANKMGADPKDQSEKYLIGNVMKKHDPRKGVTPELLAELNALGIAEFSGSGGNLTVKNTKNDPRFGAGGTSDVVYAYDAQNGDTAWQPWWVDDGGGAGAGGPLAGPSNGGVFSSGGGMSASDGMRSLAPTDNDFFQRLMAQAGTALGGNQAFDREALLRMLGAQ